MTAEWDQPQITNDDDETLILKFSSWEGPIEALLDLARTQKVDIAEINILELVDQFEETVRRAMDLRLELAADWLVMASWLAYLKSRHLLKTRKDDKKEEIDPNDLAMHLKRLDLVKKIADFLPKGQMVGRDVFSSNQSANDTVASLHLGISLSDLLIAYPKTIHHTDEHSEKRALKPFDLVSVESAIKRMEASLRDDKWIELTKLIPKGEGLRLRSNIASSLIASLELAKRGVAEVAQEDLFSEIYVRGVADA